MKNTFVDIFLKSTHSQHIAVLTMFSFNDGWADQIESLIARCNHVFIICTEVVPPVVDFIQQHHHHNVTYYLCGHLNFELKHSVVHQYMYWFDITTDFYRNWLPELLHRLHPFDTKESNFDILFLEHSLEGVVNKSNSDSSDFLHCSLGSVL